MALQKQNVTLPLIKGLDTSEDSFLSMPLKLQSLANFEFGADKRSIQTRGGWQKLVTGTAYSGDDPSSARRIMNRGSEVLIESGTGLHSADATNNKWKQVVSSLNRCAADLVSVDHGRHSVYEFDVAGTDALRVCLYTTSAGIGSTAKGLTHILRLRILQNGVVVRDEAIVSGSFVSCPRVVYGNSRFFLYWGWNDGGTLRIRGTSFAANSLGATLTVTSIKSDWTGNGQLDACYHPYYNGNTGCVMLAYPTTGTAQSVQCLNLSKSDGVTITSEANSGTVAADRIESVRCVPTSLVASSRVGFIVAASTINLALFTISYDLDAGGGATGAFTAVAGAQPVGRMSVMTDPNNTTNFWLVWEESVVPGIYNSTLYGTCLRSTTFNAGGTFTTTAGFSRTIMARSVGVETDLHYRGRSVYIGAIHYSLEQSTHFEIEVGRTASGATSARSSDRDIAARLSLNGGFIYDTDFSIAAIGSLWRSYSTGAPVAPRVVAGFPAQVGHVIVETNKTITLKRRANGDRVTVNTIDATILGLDTVTYDWTTGLNTVPVGDALVLAGANPQLYDGVACAELGFELYPETSEFATSVGGAGGLADGTYGFALLYEYIDLQGNKHQSRPVFTSAAVSGGGGVASIGVTVPMLRLTRKLVTVKLFMTEASGTVYYLQSLGALNDPTVDTVGFTAVTTVTGLTAGEQLYTTGGVLSNAPYPACKHVSVIQNRLWFAGSEEQQIRYTEERTQGFFPATNDLYVVETDSSLGRLSAVEGLDDKVLVLQERELGVVVGRAPNRLGQQNELTQVLKVLGGFGHLWAESNAVALDPDGLWFVDGDTGLRHLSRGLALSLNEEGAPLGSEVDNEVNSIRSASVLQSKKQIRFVNTTSFGNVLVWDYENKQWSQFSTNSFFTEWNGGVVADGSFVFLNNTQTWKENASTTVDDTSTAISGSLLSGYLKLDGLAGFQRLYAVNVLGKFRGSSQGSDENTGSGSLTVGTYMDYRLEEAVGPPFQSSTFNSWSAFGNTWQVEYRPTYQKCEAVRISLSYSSKIGSRISGISLRVGLKKGMRKTAGSQRL